MFNVDFTFKYECVLLVFAPVGDKDPHTANTHYLFVKFALSVYERTINNVATLLNDNKDTSQDFACALDQRL